MDDRPAPDPAALLDKWNSWASGEAQPGRTMSDLKTGGLPDVLGADAAAHQALLDAWEPWEKGTAAPADVLSALADAGLADALRALAGASAAAG